MNRFLVHICAASTVLVRGAEHAIVEESHWIECPLDALHESLIDLSQSVAFPHRFLVCPAMPAPAFIGAWIGATFQTVHPPFNSFGVPPCQPAKPPTPAPARSPVV